MDALRLLTVPALLALAACGAAPPKESPAPAGEPPPPAAPEASIKRLPVADFPELPTPIAEFLETRGCSIPQTDGVEGRSNVISGDFFDKGVEAWAALCARDGRSVPLVFHDQEDRDPTALGSIADPVCRATQAQCGFQAQIKAVPPDQIRLYDREVSGLTPPPIERQGIEIVQPGEPTVVRYLHDGVWLELIRPPSQ